MSYSLAPGEGGQKEGQEVLQGQGKGPGCFYCTSCTSRSTTQFRAARRFRSFAAVLNCLPVFNYETLLKGLLASGNFRYLFAPSMLIIQCSSMLFNPIGSMYGIYANIGGILMGFGLPYIAYMDPMGMLIFLSSVLLLVSSYAFWDVDEAAGTTAFAVRAEKRAPRPRPVCVLAEDWMRKDGFHWHPTNTWLESWVMIYRCLNWWNEDHFPYLLLFDVIWGLSLMRQKRLQAIKIQAPEILSALNSGAGCSSKLPGPSFAQAAENFNLCQHWQH